MMAGKPFGAGGGRPHGQAGIVRCEAFLESLQTRRWVAAVARTGDNGHGAGEIAPRLFAPVLPESRPWHNGANGDGKNGAHEHSGVKPDPAVRRQGGA